MAMFVVKSFHMQVVGQVYGSTNLFQCKCRLLASPSSLKTFKLDIKSMAKKHIIYIQILQYGNDIINYVIPAKSDPC